MLRIIRLTVGILLAALGILWVLQGADLIRIKPILCFAGCEPIVGGSTTWLIAGLISLLFGVLLLVLRRRPRA